MPLRVQKKHKHLSANGGFEFLKKQFYVHFFSAGGCLPCNRPLMINKEAFNFSAGENNRCMVFIAHKPTDFREAHWSVLSSQKHYQRACQADGSRLS